MSDLCLFLKYGVLVLSGDYGVFCSVHCCF